MSEARENSWDRRCLDCGALLPALQPGSICVPCLWGGEMDSQHSAEAGDPASALKGVAALRVPGHDVLEEIARGGMGIVYRAWERGPGREVALKMLRPQLGDDTQMRARFRQEARALAALNHRAILPVFRVDENEDLPFFTMQLAAGGTLAARRSEYAGQWQKTGELLVLLASAVQFAHSHGVLHRDIKPANILFDETGLPYLSDFGLVKILDDSAAEVESLTVSAHFLGTPHYSAPEVAAANAAHATVASDVWSLGAVLYELLAGRPPFQAEGLPALLRRIVEDPLPALPADVPRDLAIICRKCLTKEPEGRYASAAAFAEDITRWLENRPILARPVGSLERAVRWARRNPAPALLGTALLASLTLTAGAMWREARTSRHLLEESQASEKAAREAAEASRKAEGRALESEIRARISNGPWHERDRLIATVRDSEDLRHTPADCDLLLSLSAMPSLEPQKSIPYDRGGWEPMMDAKMLRYVTLENDGCAVRDTASGKVIHHVKSKPVGNYPPGPLSADGRLLLITGPARGEVWNAETGKLLTILPPLNVWNYFSDDGRWLVCQCLQNKRRRLIVLDLRATELEPRDITEIPDNWTPRAFSRDGSRFLAANNSAAFGLKLVETATGKVLRDFELSRPAYTHSAAFSPDGTMVYAAMIDGRLAAWPAGDSRTLWATTAHSGACDRVGVFDGGRSLITQGRDGMARIWESATGRQRSMLPWAGHHVLVSDDGNLVRVARDDLRRADILRLVPSALVSSALIPSGAAMNTYLRGGPQIAVWPETRSFAVTTGHDISTYRLDGSGPVVTLPCGRVADLTLGFAGTGLIRSVAGRVYRVPLINPGGNWAADGLRIGKRFGPDSFAPLLASAPDGRSLFVGGSNATVLLEPPPGWIGEWRQSPVPHLPGNSAAETCVLSPGGELLCWSGKSHARDQNDHDLMVIPLKADAAKPFPEWLRMKTPRRIDSAAFSAGGESLVIASSGQIICLQSAGGKVLWKHPIKDSGALPRAAVSCTGMVAATALGRGVTLLDVRSGARLCELLHPDGGTLRAVAFSADGRRLGVIAGQRFQVWRLDSPDLRTIVPAAAVLE